LSTAVVPFHSGVQLLLSEIAKERLYVDGDPVLSMSAAVVTLTYGAYAVVDDGVDEALSEGAALVFCDGAVPASDESSELEEHPVTVRANKQVSPAAGFRKLLIEHAPFPSRDGDFCLRMETESDSEG